MLSTPRRSARPVAAFTPVAALMILWPCRAPRGDRPDVFAAPQDQLDLKLQSLKAPA